MQRIGHLGRGAVLALAVLAGAAQAAEQVKLDLTATAAAPRARGSARLELRGSDRGRFLVTARKLTADTTYDVIVDGVKVATLSTTGGGGGKVRFSTRPRRRDALLGFDPRGAAVSVRAADGTDVLVGDVPAAGEDADGDVACCLPDDDADGVECEDRTPDQCTAQGGTVVAGSRSCLPDPCGAGTGGGGGGSTDDDVLCCLPDTSGDGTPDDSGHVECEDRTPAECAAGGGTVLEGATCGANPCAPVPPASVVVCCTADDDGPLPECEVRTPERCEARGGVAVEAASCTPNPCAGVVPPGTGGGDDSGGGHGGGSGGSGGGHGGGSDD